ncbi:MAG: polysulfide reductase NrfD [Coriobacteriia bacterium]|nr:polysulfide reductase NrfD [Coriobacteriia bacterium]MBS5478042.1 polysulfide reductase NrfD [Coriobacteriia bacterium]
MFGSLVVAYLFLGGAGAGVVAASCLLDLCAIRTPFGTSSRASIEDARPAERLVAYGLIAGFAMLTMGLLCLVFDLGRADRILLFLLRPRPSLLTFGAYALGALVACAAGLALVRVLYAPCVTRAFVAAAEVVAAVLALFVMAYTGLFLQSMKAVALWDTSMLPVLFVLSSCSCGLAVLLLLAELVDGDRRVDHVKRLLVPIDAVVIVLEAIAAALFVASARSGGSPAALASANVLVTGSLSTWWWLGFIVCGLAVPLAAELSVMARAYSEGRRGLAWGRAGGIACAAGKYGRALRGARSAGGVGRRLVHFPQVPAAVLVCAMVLVIMGGCIMRGVVVGAGTHEQPVPEHASAETHA